MPQTRAEHKPLESQLLKTAEKKAAEDADMEKAQGKSALSVTLNSNRLIDTDPKGEIKPQPPTKQLYTKPHSVSLLYVTFPDSMLTMVASPRPSLSGAVYDSEGDTERMIQYVRFVTSGGIPVGRSSPPAGHSGGGVTGKKSNDGDEEEEDNEEEDDDDEEDDEDDEEDEEEDDHPSAELTPILPKNPAPGVTYTRPHKIRGLTFFENDYDIPLPRTTSAEAERRRVSIGVSRLPDKVQNAMRMLQHKVHIPTVYPTISDLYSVADSRWNTHGPQCWEEAPNLCAWFAQLGNRYQQPSS